MLVDLEMMFEFVDMFEALIEIIEYRCDPSKEWDTGTEYLSVGDALKRARRVLREAKGLI